MNDINYSDDTMLCTTKLTGASLAGTQTPAILQMITCHAMSRNIKYVGYEGIKGSWAGLELKGSILLLKQLDS